MSDEKPTTKAATSGPKAAGSGKAAAGAGSKQAPKPVTKPKEKKSGRGAAVLAVFALLLALAAGGGAGYLWTEQEKLKGQQTALAQAQEGSIDEDSFAALQRPAFDSSQIESNLTALSEKLETVDVGLAAANRESEEVRLVTKGDIDRLAQENADLMQRVVEIGRTNRDDWRLAEVEYLLRLAHQRVVMGGELDSAEALLVDADNVMFELNMAGLLHVRRQVAKDLAAVRAASALDVTGIYLQLAAMQEQVPGLAFVGVKEGFDAGESAAGAEEDNAASEGDIWSKATSNLSQYVVVQKSDDKPAPLLTPAMQDLIRVQLSLKLEQAKNALLLRQGDVFSRSLAEAGELVNRHFEPENSATLSMSEGLAGLQVADIAPQLPDISSSQQAIRAFIDKTYQRRSQVDPLDDEAGADVDAGEELEVAP